MTYKFSTLDEIEEIKNSVLVYGHFTTIHTGHIRYLKNAGRNGEHLIVALIGDNTENKYQFSQIERAEGLASIDLIDKVVFLKRDELNEAISKIKPVCLVLGKEFEKTNSVIIKNAIKAMKAYGGEVKFDAGVVNYATADLLKSSSQQLLDKKYLQFKKACKRQQLSKENLLHALDKFHNCKLIVIGDSILDQYSACEALGMSAEAPVVVVKELEQKNFMGGAALIAANVSALGAHCDFVSVVGEDEHAKSLVTELEVNNVEHHLVFDNSRPTTFKKRYMVENQKLFRVSKLEDDMLAPKIEEKIIKILEKLAPNANGIIVSDFVYGLITERILKKLSELASKHGLMLFGDLQCSSQVGHVTKFINYDLLSPNEKEARIALQDKESGLEALAQKLFKKTNCMRLVMKLGANGLIAYDKSLKKMNSQSFPALSTNPIDVSGAGDSLLSVMAVGLACKESMMVSAAIGACRAAMAVDTIGNYPISKEVLKEKVNQIFKN
ncbi:PfkB family carbohydrate kinase [Prochlorococcus sp. AH-716-M09]|nr:PfkB family carbohydrate kinase [Prochlorococcus sp. AH-716-M09]